jgi:hypothetical protein
MYLILKTLWAKVEGWSHESGVGGQGPSNFATMAALVEGGGVICLVRVKVK